MSDEFFSPPKDAADVKLKDLSSFPVKSLRGWFDRHAMLMCGELMNLAKQYNLMRFREICLQDSFDP
jgi:hypothetical protein